jgi:hypothetical protein
MMDLRKLRRVAETLLLLWLAILGGRGIAQTQQTQPTPEVPSQERPSSPTSSREDAESVVSDKPITKAEAKALFRSVDEILQIVSQDTGLPIKHKVKRKLITRDQVERYVEKRLESDKDAQRLEREQLVLKKFGLIPSNYDLHAEFLKLLREQVAAFYDPKTKTVNLLDWVRPELQRPVLAHELTHALQDQSIDLRVWFRAGATDKGPEPDEQEQVVEEAQAAREGVAEGQAMVAMIDYILAPSGLNILKAPDVANAMRASMSDGKNLPVLAAAPAYLRESLLMPYAFGFDFERAVLAAKGTAVAFDGVLKNPPKDTFEVMDSDAYLKSQSVPPLRIPDLDKLIAPDYERYDFGGMGAFDVYLLAKQYVPEKDPKEYYPHWRGGYYLAAHAKSAPKDRVALIYLSRWDSPDAAEAFAKMYGDYVPKRYEGASGSKASCPVSSADPECPGRQWDTSQGRVFLEIRGNEVLVLEGLNDAVVARARANLF